MNGVEGEINVTHRIDISRFTPLQRRIVFLCLLLGLADGFNSLAVGYAIPSLADRWDVPVGAFSFVIIAALVGEILASVLLAPLADRLGRRTMIVIGIVTFSAATLLASGAPGLAPFVVWRFFAGVGIGTASPNLFALSSEYAPRRFKSTGVTVLGSGMALGGALCGIVAGYVVPAYGGAAIFVIAGAAPLAVLLLVIAFIPDSLELYVVRGKSAQVARILNRIEGTTRYTAADRFVVRTDQDVRASSVVELFRRGRALTTVLLWAIFFLGIAGSYFVFSWLTTLLTISGVEESAAIFAGSVATIGGIVGGIALGVMLDRSRLGVASLLVGTLVQVLATVTLAVMLAAAPAAGFVLGVSFFLGFGIVGTGTALTAVAVRTYAAQLRSTGLGWATGVSRTGAILAPLVGGVLIDTGMSAPMILMLSLLPALINGVLFVVFRRYAVSAHTRTEEEVVLSRAPGSSTQLSDTK